MVEHEPLSVMVDFAKLRCRRLPERALLWAWTWPTVQLDIPLRGM